MSLPDLFWGSSTLPREWSSDSSVWRLVWPSTIFSVSSSGYSTTYSLFSLELPLVPEYYTGVRIRLLPECPSPDPLCTIIEFWAYSYQSFVTLQCNYFCDCLLQSECENLSSLRVVLIFRTSQRLFGIKSDEEAGEYKFLLQMKYRKKLSMAVLWRQLFLYGSQRALKLTGTDLLMAVSKDEFPKTFTIVTVLPD